MIAQHTAVLQQQTNQLVFGAGLALGLDGLATDEVALARFPRHGPAQCRFQRTDCFIHVRTVQVHTGLKTQCVACTQPGRLYTGRTQLAPEDRRIGCRQDNLEAVLAGVTGACYEPLAVEGTIKGFQVTGKGACRVAQ